MSVDDRALPEDLRQDIEIRVVELSVRQFLKGVVRDSSEDRNFLRPFISLQKRGKAEIRVSPVAAPAGG